LKYFRLTKEEFVELLNILNPFDKMRAKRALMELDLNHSKPISFQDFKLINERFPVILHPAFKFQLSMRNKTMGENWWINKLRKYKEVCKSMMSLKLFRR
jgi:hypothetical protein